jgi:hypothetical protein
MESREARDSHVNCLPGRIGVVAADQYFHGTANAHCALGGGRDDWSAFLGVKLVLGGRNILRFDW